MANWAEANELQLFVRDGLPGGWLELSDELIDAAEALWAADRGLRLEGVGGGSLESLNFLESRTLTSISRPYMLLAGFAVENVLKGLLVAQHPEYITSGVLHKSLKSHKLSSLAKSVEGLSLSSEEDELLQMLEKAIPYWGRYPIPAEKNQVMPDVSLTPARRDTIRGLRQRLGAMLYNKIRNGWDSGVGPKTIYCLIERYEEDDGSE